MSCALVSLIRTPNQIEMFEKLLQAIPKEVDIYLVYSRTNKDNIFPIKRFTRVINLIDNIDDDFKGKTHYLNLGVKKALETKKYDFVYVTMVDVIIQKDGFIKLKEDLNSHPECVVTTPFFINPKGDMRWTGQWSGMQSCEVYFFEFLSFLARADVLRKVLPDERSITCYYNQLEFPFRLQNLGHTIRKCVECQAIHLGSTTHGRVPTRFKTREEYTRAGDLELIQYAKDYFDGDLGGLFREIANIVSSNPLGSRQYNSLMELISWHMKEMRTSPEMIPVKNRPRIVLSMWALFQGGVESIYRRLGQYLTDNGYEVFYVYWDASRIPHPWFWGRNVVRLSPNVDVAWQMVWLCKSLGIDVVMLFEAPHVIRDLQSANINVIEYFTSRAYYKRNCGFKRTSISNIVFECPTLYKERGRSELFKECRVTQINQPIVKFPNISIVNPKQTIVRLGRIHPMKNPVLFGEIANLMKDRYEFIWIGGPCYKQESIYNQCVSKYKSVKWIGNVFDTDQVFDIVSSSLCMLCTSSVNYDDEGISNAILESLSYGVPVVSTKAGCIPDVIIEGQTGYKTQLDNSPQEFVSLINKIESKGRKYWFDRCRKFILDNYNEDKTLGEWKKFFDLVRGENV